MLQDLDRPIVHTSLVVGHTVLLAERFHQSVHLREVVSRNLGEQVVVHLELQSATEPVYERRARHVARRRHLGVTFVDFFRDDRAGSVLVTFDCNNPFMI